MTNGFIEKVAEQISDKHSRKLITTNLNRICLTKSTIMLTLAIQKKKPKSVPPKKWAIPMTRLFRLILCITKSIVPCR